MEMGGELESGDASIQKKDARLKFYATSIAASTTSPFTFRTKFRTILPSPKPTAFCRIRGERWRTLVHGAGQENGQTDEFYTRNDLRSSFRRETPGTANAKKLILDSLTMACFFSRFRPLSWAHECQSFVAALDSVISAADPDSAVGDHTGPQSLSTIGYRKSRQPKGALS